jgi:hypothetical protein
VDTSVGFARPAESNAVEREERCRVVCIASCDDLLDARLIERPRHQGGSRLARVPTTAPIRDDAVSDFENARGVRWPEKTDVPDDSRAFPLDDHPHPESLPDRRGGRLDRQNVQKIA